MSDFERNMIVTSILVQEGLQRQQKINEQIRQVANGDTSSAENRQKQALNQAETDSDYWRDRALKAEKELKTAKYKLDDVEAKVLDQWTSCDEAFQDLVNEFGYDEQEKEKIKKQHLRWQVRSQQIMEKREAKRKAEAEAKANEPKKLVTADLKTLQLFHDKYHCLKPNQQNEYQDLKTRFEYWYEKGLYQDIKLSKSNTTPNP